MEILLKAAAIAIAASALGLVIRKHNPDMEMMLNIVPSDRLVLGNVSPAQVFNGNSVKTVEMETLKLLKKCGGYKNFIPSSGCDIAPEVDLDNVKMFFDTVEGFYYRQWLRNAIS